MAAKSKTGLPFDNLKIMYADVKVTGISSEQAEKRCMQGEYHAKKQEIEFDESLTETEKLNTVFHEVGHALVHTMGIKFHSGEQEEDVINSLAAGYITALKDNPAFLDWIQAILFPE